VSSKEVGDGGLKHLHGLTGLQELDLTGIEVTPEGLADLRRALPKCQIVTRPATK
jgi:hypothetical protein